MAEAILDIKQWGNNLGVRLPAAVARIDPALHGGEAMVTDALGAEQW